MCGIAGFIDFTNKSSLANVKAMAAALPHRGPDGQGEYFHVADNCQIGLGIAGFQLLI